MNLSDTIYAHAQALPIDLQRETLDFIAYLEQRPQTTASHHHRSLSGALCRLLER
jgi:hypothetical protein